MLVDYGGRGRTSGLEIAQIRTKGLTMFQIRESKKVELRVEAFNLTNSVRLNDPVTNFNAGNFGQITSAQDPRIMQFALKYVF